MTKSYYVDTSVWRDYHEDRVIGVKPFGEFAFQFFRYCKENKCAVLYSELIVRELNLAYNDEEIKKIMEIVSDFGLLRKVEEPTEEQYKEAKKLRSQINIPLFDILHAILARDNNAILVYRDKHFHELQKIVEIKYPEQIT